MQRRQLVQVSLPKSQQGVALFISLVLLLVLTIIGVSSVQTTSLEVRMSRNEHDTLLAFQAAESALRDAEGQLLGITTTTPFDGTGALYAIADLGTANHYENAATWTGANSVSANVIAGTAAPPRYMIEYVGPVLREENANQIEDPYAGAAAVDRVEIFRITARGTGGTVNAQVFLQTTYGRIMD